MKKLRKVKKRKAKNWYILYWWSKHLHIAFDNQVELKSFIRFATKNYKEIYPEKTCYPFEYIKVREVLKK